MIIQEIIQSWVSDRGKKGGKERNKLDRPACLPGSLARFSAWMVGYYYFIISPSFLHFHFKKRAPTSIHKSLFIFNFLCVWTVKEVHNTTTTTNTWDVIFKIFPFLALRLLAIVVVLLFAFVSKSEPISLINCKPIEELSKPKKLNN